MPNYTMTMTIEGCTDIVPGQPLKGHLLFESTKRSTVKDLKVVIKGTAVVDTPGRFPVSSRTLNVYDAILRDGRTVELRQGPDSVSFGIPRLPDDLPPSVDVRGLRLTYKVTVTYSKTFGRGVLADQVIIIQPWLDLSRYPLNLVYGQRVSRQEWVHQGKYFVFARLDLPSCSFAIGDKIRFQVTISNQSENTHIKLVVCTLQRVITHTYKRKSYCVTHLAVRGGSDMEEVRPGNQRQTHHTMALSDLPPTGLLRREDLNIDYKIKLVVIPRNEGFPALTVEVPVIVGTKPNPANDEGGGDFFDDSGLPAMFIDNPSTLGTSAATTSSNSVLAEASLGSEAAKFSVTRTRTREIGPKGLSTDESNTRETSRNWEGTCNQRWESRPSDMLLTNLKTPNDRHHAQSAVAAPLLEDDSKKIGGGTYGAIADPGGADFEHQGQFESDTQLLQPKPTKIRKRTRHDK